MFCAFFIFTLLIQTGTTLTLEEAVDIALESNISVRKAEEDIFSAKTGYRKSLSAFLPTLSFSSSYTRYPDEITQETYGGGEIVLRAKGTHQTGFSMSLPLFTGGSRLINVRMNNSLVRLAEYKNEMTKDQIVLGTLSAYLGLVQSSKALTISREALETALENLNLTNEMLRVGMVTNLDLARSEVQVAQEEGNLLTAQNNYENAVNSLCDILQIEKTEISVVEPEFLEVVLPEFDSCMIAALNSPSLALSEVSLSIARSGKALSVSSFMPTVSAFAGYSWSGNNFEFGEPNYYGGVQLSWTLFQGTARIHDYSGAASDVRSAELDYLDVHSQTASTVDQNYREVRQAFLQYEIALKTVVAAQEAYDLTDRMYKNGLATSLELYEAMNTLEKARLGEISAYYGIYLSYSKLLATMGVLNDFVQDGGLYE
ncbi:TolC family protein [candidate division WOR-3 bacterium]|nr:TolC family protein [candidate division WOR-3 bacterium]